MTIEPTARDDMAGPETGTAEPELPSTQLRDWELFDDWCRSHGAEPAEQLIDAFLSELPVARVTARRRRRAIRIGLRQLGYLSDDVDPSVRSSLVRTGEEWATVGEALAQLPKWRFPRGLRGRRDAWLVVVCVQIGLTRSQACALTPGEITDTETGWTIAGHPVPHTEDAAGCPACAVARWLEVLSLVRFHPRSELISVLAPPPTEPREHRCVEPVDGEWRERPFLTVAIDAHGHVDVDDPLSTRSVSTVMKSAQRFTGRRDTPARALPSGGRFANATLPELADAYDDVDARLEALLDRAAAALEDGRDMLDFIADAGIDPDE